MITKQSMDAAEAALRKTAQSLLDRLKDGAGDVAASAHSNMDDFAVRLKDQFDRLPPEVKKTLYGALAGGAAGGSLGAISGLAGHGEDNAFGAAFSRGGVGALMGAGAGALGTGGYQLLSQGRTLPGEEQGFAPVKATTDALASEVVSHPGVAAGVAAGGIYAGRNMPTYAKARDALNKLIASTPEGDEQTRLLQVQKQFERMASGDYRLGLDRYIQRLKTTHPNVAPLLQRIVNMSPAGLKPETGNVATKTMNPRTGGRVGNWLHRNAKLVPGPDALRARKFVAQNSGLSGSTGSVPKVLAGLVGGPAAGLLAERYVKGEE